MFLIRTALVRGKPSYRSYLGLATVTILATAFADHGVKHIGANESRFHLGSHAFALSAATATSATRRLTKHTINATNIYVSRLQKARIGGGRQGIFYRDGYIILWCLTGLVISRDGCIILWRLTGLVRGLKRERCRRLRRIRQGRNYYKRGIIVTAKAAIL